MDHLPLIKEKVWRRIKEFLFAFWTHERMVGENMFMNSGIGTPRTYYTRILMLSMHLQVSRLQVRDMIRDDPEKFEKFFEGVDWSRWVSNKEMNKIRDLLRDAGLV